MIGADGLYRNAAGPLVLAVQSVLREQHDSLKLRFTDGATASSPPRPTGRIDHQWSGYLAQVQAALDFPGDGHFFLDQFTAAGDVYAALREVMVETSFDGPTLMPLSGASGATDIRFAQPENLNLSLTGARPHYPRRVVINGPIQHHFGPQGNRTRHAAHALLSVDWPSIVLIVSKREQTEQAAGWQRLVRNTEWEHRSRVYYWESSPDVTPAMVASMPLLAQYLDPYQLILILDQP